MIAIMWVVAIVVTIRTFVMNYLATHRPKDNTINSLFYTLSIIPSVKNTFKKIYSMQVYEESTLKYNLSVNMIEKLIILLFVYIGLLVFTQELFLSIILMPIAITIVMKIYESQVDKVYLEILKAIPPYISELQNAYISTQSVKSAISTVNREDILTRLIVSFRQLTTKDFNAEKEYRHLLDNDVFVITSLATAIYITDDLGESDKAALDTPFVKDLVIITDECMKELQLSSKRWGQFGALQALFYISPVVLLAINWYVQHNMVMITHIYNGIYGTVMKLISVLFWCVGFTYVNTLRSVFRLGKSDSNPLYDMIADKLGDYKKGFTPNELKLQDLNDKFELNGSDLNANAFYVKKMVYGIAAYLITLILVSMSLFFSRENVRYSQSSFGLSGSSGITEEWAHIFQEIDERFITGGEDINSYTDMEIADMYTSNIPDLSTTKGLNNASRIKQKVAVYKSMTLDWKINLYCLVMAIIFYFVPNILMKLTQIDTEYLRRIDVKKLYTLLTIFTDTTLSAYNMLSMMAIQCSVLIKEIYYTRELMAYEPNLLERRKRNVRPDLSAIYSKIFYISDKLQPCEALSDAFEIKKNNNIMDFNEEDQKIENERSRVLMLPVLVILFIVFVLVAGPLYNTAMSQINDAISQW